MSPAIGPGERDGIETRVETAFLNVIKKSIPSQHAMYANIRTSAPAASRCHPSNRSKANPIRVTVAQRIPSESPRRRKPPLSHRCAANPIRVHGAANLNPSESPLQCEPDPSHRGAAYPSESPRRSQLHPSRCSALQIAIGGIERFEDDFNSIISVNELKSFVPCEDLLDLVDKLENNYKQ